jgi:hypothetical protein
VRRGELEVGLQRGEVLPEFVVQFPRQPAPLAFLELQVAQRGVLQFVEQQVLLPARARQVANSSTIAPTTAT